jgi:hypothetical protein
MPFWQILNILITYECILCESKKVSKAIPEPGREDP